MTCKTTFDAGITQRDQATASLAIAIATLTTAAMPLVPTIGAMTPLGAALGEVQTAKRAMGLAMADFHQALMCYATAGDGPGTQKSASNASLAAAAMTAAGQAENAIQGAMAACMFLFPTAAISVTTAIAEAGNAVGACKAIVT